MKIFWFLLYNTIVIPIIYLGAHVASLFSTKIKLGIAGRKNALSQIERLMRQNTNYSECVLFHCASLGEFEQIKPVLKSVTADNPDRLVVVSFFSPSGFDNVKTNSDYSLKIYLPFDTMSSVRKFLNLLKPKLVVISKHDVWPNLVWTCSSRNIPVLLVNGTMPADSKMIKPLIRVFFKSFFSDLSFIAAANKYDAEGFNKIISSKNDMQILGDTRYDQVFIRAEESKRNEILPEMKLEDRLVFVAGSTWESDEKHLLPALIQLYEKFSNLFVILVPHELEKKHLQELYDSFDSEKIQTTFYSNTKKSQDLLNFNLLIVDEIGLLANLYYYADAAFVGGSFGPGVHNVMEPAAHGIPVLFGPRILNSPDALELKKREAGFMVLNSDDVFYQLDKLFSDKEVCEKAGKGAKELVIQNQGATEKISSKIVSLLELKSN